MAKQITVCCVGCGRDTKINANKSPLSALCSRCVIGKFANHSSTQRRHGKATDAELLAEELIENQNEERRKRRADDW